MSKRNRNDILEISIIVLLCLSVFGIWYVYKARVARKKQKQQMLDLKDRFELASLKIKAILSSDRYFSNRDEQLYTDEFRGLRTVVPAGFDNLDLPDEFVNQIQEFVQTFDDISNVRKRYNDDFLKSESEKYADFFNTLEEYPLSADQVEAIIRDEDNNLVIAGAGTGKTTTISGKVAYLLKKGLAAPGELLIISFTNNAVNEMRERCLQFCNAIPGAENLDVRTFNGFGYYVHRDCSNYELNLAFNGKADPAKTFLQETFNRLFMEDAEFQNKAVNFMAFFTRPVRDEFEFETRDEYMKYEASLNNVTLDGTEVKSKEELEIANFFCLNSLNYEYEKHYPLMPEDRVSNHASYHPDFYLTDHEIWLEHYGIDRNGNVPQWFNIKTGYATPKDYYNGLIKWKEGIHQKYNTKLLKTYSFENKEGRLLSNLKQKLIDLGVTLTPRSPEEIFELIKTGSDYKDFINLIYTFLGLMKSNRITPDTIIPHSRDKRLKVFLDVFTPIYREYEAFLCKKSLIDFNDMINHASDHFSNGEFKKPYKYVLVDEFQDMSLGRYELLKSVRKQNPAVKLYAVGDDWQSIFRFTGSDISIITEFEKHFGYTSTTPILRTYRFNDEILNVSSDYIQKNPAQIRKTLTALRAATEKSFEFFELDGGGPEYYQKKWAQVKNILREIGEHHPGAKVFLIGRYHHNRPVDINGLRSEFRGLTIEYFTAHRVKGMTCDFSIILDVNSGKLGFPSEIADDPLLNSLLHEGDKFENAEERRVFYVAITRARHKNYFIYNLVNPSKFIVELRESFGMEGDAAKRCPECGGLLVKRTGPFSEFYGCSNYPRCEAKLPLAVGSQAIN